MNTEEQQILTNLNPIQNGIQVGLQKLCRNTLITEENKMNSARIKKFRNKLNYAKWTSTEDAKLKEIVQLYGNKDWNKVSEYFLDKSSRQCNYRWYQVILPSINNQWTEKEDQFLLKYTANNGNKNWTICAKIMNTGKTGKNCKDRWYNVLSIKQKNEKLMCPREELKLLMMVDKMGTCWSKIVNYFPNRTQNQIKNRTYSILRKYAMEHYKRNEKDCSDIKVNQTLIFLPLAIEKLKNLVGPENLMSNKLNSNPNLQNLNNPISLFSHTNSKNNTECKINSCFSNITGSENMIKINLCSNCQFKLKEKLKKKFLEKIIQNHLSNINFISLNQQINIDTNSVINNTTNKLDSVRDVLKSFVQNI